MVLYKEDGKVYIKIVYWGMAGSGKTTILETLYRLTKENSKEIVPVQDVRKIERASGATLYWDMGIFQSKSQRKVYYRVFTVAGQKGFSPLRIKLFNRENDDTDAVIFVADSQTSLLEENTESLLELKSIANDRLIKKIPFIIMLNKQDLEDIIDYGDFTEILQREKLWYEKDHALHKWNPIIYETCALYEKQENIYESFRECARRAAIYQIYGNGKAPDDDDFDDPSI